MSKSYSSVLKQIDELKAVAEQLRRKEVEGVIARIREAIAVYGLSAADLGLAGRPGRKPGSKAAGGAATPAGKKARRGRKKAGAGAVKYRDDQGNGWVGRGKRPQWLRDALAAGKSLDDFLVK